MSNLFHPLKTVEVKDSIVDFIEPAYIVRKPANLKSFQINNTQTYSNSAITTKLEVSNTQMVIDRNILWEQPISVVINGNTSNGTRLLQDGAFGVRSNPLAKIVNTLNVQYGSVSYAFTSSDVISALERYNSYDCNKYQTNISESYLDQSQTYDELLGTNRNPLNLFSVGSGSQNYRGGLSQMTDIVNPVSVQGANVNATFKMTLRGMLTTAPLLDQILRHGTGYGLTHLNNINIDLTLVPALGARLFSIMKNVNGGSININSISVVINNPVFRFIQVSPHFDTIPPIITYGLNTLERYPTDFTFTDRDFLVPSQVIQLSRIPHYLMFFARYTNNVLQNGVAGVNGAQIPDCFASLISATIDFDGETLMSNADSSMFYKMSSENQLVDNFVAFNGSPVVRSFASDNATYNLPVGSVCKLVFNKDISLKKQSLASGVNYRTNIQVNARFRNPNWGLPSNYSNNYTFYLVAVYDDILQLYGDNNAQIGYAPLSEADVLNSHKQNEKVHYDVMRNHNLTGAGIVSGLTNLITHGKKLFPYISDLFNSKTGNYVRGHVKGFLRENGGDELADQLEAYGFGGAKAPRHRLQKNLLR